MPFMFENLQVRQKAVDLADRVAALSIATNLAEGTQHVSARPGLSTSPQPHVEIELPGLPDR